MRTLGAEVTLGAALMAWLATACTGDARKEPASAMQDDDTGAASQAWAPAYCIINAHTDQGTVHFEGPKWRLASSEGAGPLLIDLRIHKFVLPAISTTGNYKPEASTVSTAVGYSMTEWYGLFDFSLVTISSGQFKRVEAYPAFQRTIWEIRDADCNQRLGIGASYKPIGVYFKVVNTMGIALPDIGVRVVETLDDGSGVVVPGGPAPAGGPSDAGA